MSTFTPHLRRRRRSKPRAARGVLSRDHGRLDALAAVYTEIGKTPVDIRREDAVTIWMRRRVRPSASGDSIGALIAYFRSSIPSPSFPCLRFTGRPAQNSGPSGSLILSREALSSSTPYRFISAPTLFSFMWRGRWYSSRQHSASFFDDMRPFI